MSLTSPAIYSFGPFELNPRERKLLRDGRSVPLTPKVFDLLCMLVQRHGHILTKDEIMSHVWAHTIVEDANLAQSISVLRKALGHAPGNEFIQTVSRFGYRFVFPVNSPETPSEPRKSLPETRYARSGDVNIAYQVLGNGPIDLVFVMGWVSHLEYFWAEPSFAHFLKTLASFSRLILFDKRGTGLSDRVPLASLPTLEERMDDVRAVLDAVGSERAVIMGVSEGGPMSALFAATYPGKTLALIMIGSYAKRLRDERYPWGPTIEDREEFMRQLQEEWGGSVGLEDRAPSRAEDPEFRQWWSTYLRMGASPGAAIALTRMNMEIDVRHVLSTVNVPSLVLHRSGDRCLAVEEGRYVASLIPGAEFVELPGEDHLPFVGDQSEIIEPIRRFLSQLETLDESERVLATVLYLDAGSPLDAFASLVRREIQRFRGHQTQDGSRILATFDGPARAIRCACSILRASQPFGVTTRAGLHTGECDRVDGTGVRGIAVDIASDVLQEAFPDEIIVSSTVKDLVAGSGIHFIPADGRCVTTAFGTWHLFRVDHVGQLNLGSSRASS